MLESMIENPTQQKVQWLELYEAAILELNPEQMRSKIRLAHEAMRERQTELRNLRDDSLQEQRAIFDALSNLLALERVELKSSCSGSRQNRHAPESPEL